MVKYGFKELTVENWKLPDDTLAVFVRMSPDGKTSSITGEDWMLNILAPQLNEAVPEDVRGLFEVARGAFAYGYFFYPLYTLGQEQLYRLVENAVNLKCQSLSITGLKKKSFKQKIDCLIEKNVIREQDKLAWSAIWELRNMASHPDHQSIVPPQLAINVMQRIAEKLNSLFP